MWNLQKPFASTLLYLFYALITFVNCAHHLDSHLGNIVVSCGSSSNLSSSNGREWISDTDSSLSTLHLGGKSLKSIPLKIASSDVVPSAPYTSAWASIQQFTYTFTIQPGQKLIRLHFYSTTYKGFDKSKAFFTVKAGPFTLLENFSPAILAQALKQDYLVKEFCFNIEPDQSLNITFYPSPKTRSSEDFYAFINGIEIVATPKGLYFTKEGEQGAQVVGEEKKSDVNNSTALEMVKRLNIGGNSLLNVEDSGMFRRWDDDSKYILESGVAIVNVFTRYPQTPAYLAPSEIYQTARSTGLKDQPNMHNLAWRIPVDSGFRYLIRFHIGEFDTMMGECREMEFLVMINNKKAEATRDVITWSSGDEIIAHRDYIVAVKEDREDNEHNLLIDIQPKLDSKGKHYHGSLTALEIFKLSNLNNSLACTYFKIDHLHILASGPRTKLQVSIYTRIKYTLERQLASAVILMIILGYCLQLHSESNSGTQKVGSSTQSHGCCDFSESNSGTQKIGLSTQNHGCREFTLQEIWAATAQFDTKFRIGQGGFGSVYKGVIEIDGRQTVVAVKRLNSTSQQGLNEFRAEIDSLSKLQHKNLVSLIGFCQKDPEMILVYEYMSRGSLKDHIHKSSTSTSTLPWRRRLEIAIDITRGLKYMHTCENRVVHRDLKSSNILLTEDWVTKISDFGLCKIEPPNESLTHFTTGLKGTWGYLDPEYHSTNKLTWKSDVYAFGVVLLELLSGRKAHDTTLKVNQWMLATWGSRCIRNGNFDKIIDRTCLHKFLEIAYQCLLLLSDQRPSIEEVLESLETALGLQQNPTSRDQLKDCGGEIVKIYSKTAYKQSLVELRPPMRHQKTPTIKRRQPRFSLCSLIQFQLSPSTVMKIFKGDITDWFVDGSSDAIVNPAKPTMLGANSGTDEAIHRAAGPELQAACYEIPELRPGVRCPTGKSRITPGFRLPSSHIIHTAGPLYGYDPDPEHALKDAYKNSLNRAKMNNIRYIAFPAISCGAGKYPYEEAAAIAISTVREFASGIKEVHFVMFLDETCDVWVKKAIELLK